MLINGVTSVGVIFPWLESTTKLMAKSLSNDFKDAEHLNNSSLPAPRASSDFAMRLSQQGVKVSASE